MPPNPPAARPAGAAARRAREPEILNAIAQALNASVDLVGSLAAALSQAARLLDLGTGWVFLLDEATGEPRLAAAQNLPPGLAEAPRRMAGSCHCLDAFRAGGLDGAANVSVVTCSRLAWLAGQGTGGLRFHASIALRGHGGRPLGVMNLAGAEWRELSGAELRLLRTVGDMLGVAIERARLYARQAEAGAAEERSRLAREIHDTLAQGLAAIALRLDTADALLAAGAERAQVRAALAEALRLARAGLEEARRSVLDLRPAPLEGRTLAEALADLARSAPAGGPAVRFTATAAARRRLPAAVETGLYRVAQEALANALRHAGAGTVRLRLAVGRGRARLRVEDDGCSFAPEAARAPGCFGLTGLAERVRRLGGALSIDSAPGAGTRIEAVVPLGDTGG